MELQRLLYYNEYSGLVEPFNCLNIKQAEMLNIGNDSFYTEDVAQMLYVDKEVRFPLFESKINMNDFLLGKPKMETNERVYELIFKLVESSSSSLIIDVKEAFDSEDYSSVGKIQFYKKKGEVINGQTGDAVVRIYDVPYLSGANVSQRMLGQFATKVGLFYFFDLDGDWAQLGSPVAFVNATRTALANNINDFTKRQTNAVEESIVSEINDVKERQDSYKDEIIEHISAVSSKIDGLENSLKIYKEDLESKLDEVYGEFDRENLISAFSDQLLNRIRRSFKEFHEGEAYDETVKSLRNLFDKQWDKLGNISKDFLVTAKLLFDNMNSIERPLDYSGVCILVSKTVEVELKDRLFYKYCTYLTKKISDDYDKWPYALCREKKKNGISVLMPIDESNFTLGTVPHVCCLYKPSYMSDEIYQNSKSNVIEFAMDELFATNNPNDAREKLKYIGKIATQIKDKYRNPAAHSSALNREVAQKCFDEIIDVQRELKKILSFIKT